MISQSLATLLSIALAVDGGTPDTDLGIMIEGSIAREICVASPLADHYYEDADAGVYEVPGILTKDGRQLGRGWYLTPERMQRVGAAVDKPTEPVIQPSGGFVLGVVVGVISTVVAIFAIRKAADK